MVASRKKRKLHFSAETKGPQWWKWLPISWPWTKSVCPRRHVSSAKRKYSRINPPSATLSWLFVEGTSKIYLISTCTYHISICKPLTPSKYLSIYLSIYHYLSIFIHVPVFTLSTCVFYLITCIYIYILYIHLQITDFAGIERMEQMDCPHCPGVVGELCGWLLINARRLLACWSFTGLFRFC